MHAQNHWNEQPSTSIIIFIIKWEILMQSDRYDCLYSCASCNIHD